MSESINQAEHEQISTSLEVEQLDANLFRSKSLWLPLRGRGVFGGQVISQALVSATKCVDDAYGLHSLHCYFLLSASPSTPIIYYVDRLREGRSYATLAVRAAQNGRTVFILMCSFHKPEPWQPSHQWPMPDVLSPELCELEETRFIEALQSDSISSRAKTYYEQALAERSRSPIAVKRAITPGKSTGQNGVYIYWMKARNIPKYGAPFQKCILSYISDLYFIGTTANILGLKRSGEGPDSLGMTSTVDHSIYFYNDDFDCGDWLLHVMISPRIGSGRGIMHGRMYTRDGALVAVTTQEGVVRTNIRGPSERAKL